MYLDGLHIIKEVQVKLWSNSTRVYTVMNSYTSHSITLTCHVLKNLIPSLSIALHHKASICSLLNCFPKHMSVI